MTKKVGVIEGVIGLASELRNVAVGGPDAVTGRDDVLRDEWDSIIVDTVAAFDTGAWETGVKRSSHWEIVEQYAGRDEAVVGHAKWVALLKADPKADLPNEVYWE